MREMAWPATGGRQAAAGERLLITGSRHHRGPVTKYGERGDGGFTVLEVLVAVVILGLAYVAVLQNFSLSMRNAGRVEEVRDAVFAEMVAFEDLLRSGDPDQLAGVETFLEGNYFYLAWVESEDGRFSTLVMNRR